MENEPTTPPAETPAEPAEPAAPGPENNNNRNMGMLCHLLAVCGLTGIPIGNILGPLVMWLLKREESEFVDACGKEALNFQISMTLYMIISGLLFFAIIGMVLLPVVVIINIVCTIIASVRASEGTIYQYPLSIHLIK